jgi:CRISPR-associated exonuclease Cas4
MLTLTVSDIKQYTYCPRIVYFTYCLPLKRPLTYKMEEGDLQHERVAELEQRRSLRAYGLNQGERQFGVHLYSERLELSGLLDMVIIGAQEPIPVEFKYSTGKPGLNHKYQLTAYALLVEDKWHKAVRRGFIYLIPLKEALEVPVTANMRRFVLGTMAEIREMVDREAMPEPTRRRERCRDCEFVNFCADV